MYRLIFIFQITVSLLNPAVFAASSSNKKFVTTSEVKNALGRLLKQPQGSSLAVRTRDKKTLIHATLVTRLSAQALNYSVLQVGFIRSQVLEKRKRNNPPSFPEKYYEVTRVTGFEQEIEEYSLALKERLTMEGEGEIFLFDGVKKEEGIVLRLFLQYKQKKWMVFHREYLETSSLESEDSEESSDELF